MIDRLKIWVSSKSWFWVLRTWQGRLSFVFERSAYKRGASASEAKENTRILGSIAWIGVKGLFVVVVVLATLKFIENYIENYLGWPPPLSADDEDFTIDQLRLYAQLLTAIFSIYFATIGIILSSGYTRLRRDIIQMLTREQVGSVYARVLVLAAIFCLLASAAPIFGFEPGLLIYVVGTVLTLLSALALFPLGQRIFNFFDLNLLVRSEILPSIARHIEGAANDRNSISLSNHHSKAARQSLEQLFYIDDRVKTGKESLGDSLPALSNDYTALLLHYFQKKHTISQESYWFPRKSKHKQWFLAGDSTTSMALQMSNQQILVEEQPDYQWLENEIVERLAGHVELAFQVGDFNLAMKLIGRFSIRTSAYAERFQFDVGMQELERFKEIIEESFASSIVIAEDKAWKTKVGIADTWAALGSNLCIETLRRMMTFEKELKQFFEKDEWSRRSLRRLPAFLQIELAFIVERIEFEQEIEGERLSKPKYVQQLAVQKLLQHYLRVLSAIRDFYQRMVPDFVGSIANLKMSKAATQVLLASLHSHWKVLRWFDEVTKLLDRYQKYGYYTDELYKLCEINIAEMSTQLASARDDAISMLGSGDIVGHIFEPKHNDELPDHFGQIYFELAEACIGALEQNDESKLDRVLPMFLSLAFLAADSKFADPSLEINDEFRLHLISTVINDLASVLGFAMLYGAYFDNEKLSESALAKFDTWIERAADKQKYLKRMVFLSNPYSFSIGASPRGLIRINWKMSFEHRARNDGFDDQMTMGKGKQHPDKLVREFLRSLSDASHLFFAKKIVPQLDTVDFDIDHQISSLARRLREGDKKGGV
ncbi:hypothetical protein [Halopseudomonas pelagia]|uniref:DUF2254 domain-containing protein n=1 Tax=Halopseudomonas pelagia TaxID=553151 RepID=A0AA91Z7V1_9GAMM|nr:hypothetical protein [Halopseudomonas pelagia]PCD01150.1 hypothetical protein CO192_01550 [Halopseudomonas pelagia]QFY57056.1 hypothetical protein EAO82_12205 [Halopseudomonas pelagia]